MDVVIVEDQTMLLDSLAMAISSQPDMRVVASFNDAMDVVEWFEARASSPGFSAEGLLFLMDVCTKNDSSGIVAARRLKALASDAKVVIMTAMPEITFVNQAREAGAESFVYKNVGTAELLSVMRSTMAGYATFPRAAEADHGFSGLSSDEVKILRLVCESRSRKEIAEKLYLSEGTVKRRISEILAKTGYDSIMKLAVHAVSNGYIVPSLDSED